MPHSDTQIELSQISELSARFLGSNPRRIKRLLNTYRYVTMLAAKRGEPVDQESWQKTAIAWLVFTMKWPACFGRLLTPGSAAGCEERKDQRTIEALLAEIGNDCPRPTNSEMQTYLSIDRDLFNRLRDLAGNFLIEFPASVGVAGDGQQNKTVLKSGTLPPSSSSGAIDKVDSRRHKKKGEEQ